jgi:uncharacterized phage-associated protein
MGHLTNHRQLLNPRDSSSGLLFLFISVIKQKRGFAAGEKNMKEKTKQFLCYIGDKHNCVTVTGVMKLSYLVDLYSVRHGAKQISDFSYERYFFGPFDKSIYDLMKELVQNKAFSEKPTYSPYGDEYITYEYNSQNKYASFNHLTKAEKATLDAVLSELAGLGPKALTEIAYRTGPMKKIGAKQNNDKGLHQALNLNS